MRKLLPSLLVLLLLSLMLVAAAASAHASSLPVAAVAATFSGAEEEAFDLESEGGDEAEGAEPWVEGEGDGCAGEEGEPCEEEVAEEAGECVLRHASVAVAILPGTGQVRLTVRYDAFTPATVLVSGSLRGGKGSLHLGRSRAHFRRSGVYRDSFSFGPKQMAKALAAREVDVDLQAAGTPAECGLHLASRAPGRAR